MLAPPGVVIIPPGGCGVSSRMLAPPSFRSSLSVVGGEVGQVRSRVELFEQIRRDRRLEELSIRELAERHGVHRRTVRQALAAAVPPPRKAYPPRPRPAIDPWAAVIDGWLLADQDAPRKQRHTARRVWQRLVAEHGATLSEVTVSRYVARRRVELGLVHAGGGDPADASGRRGGRGRLRRVLRHDRRRLVIKCWMFVMRLSHSGKAFHVAFATQAQEAFLEGPCAGVRALRRRPRPGPLRQPQTRGRPGAEGPGPDRVRTVHRAAQPLRVRLVLLPPRHRRARTRRAASRARSAGSAAATSSRSRRSPRWRS